MPFIAECPYCKKGKIRAPDNAVGWSAECPNPECGSSFTLVPAEKQPKAAAAMAAPAATPAPAPTVAVVESAPQVSTTETEPVAPPTAPARYPFRHDRSEPATAFNYLALSSFFVGSAALMCASLPVLDRGVIPLTILGLLLGLLGIIWAVGKETPIRWATVGPALNLVTLLAVLLVPSLFDVRRSLDRQARPRDPTEKRVVVSGTQSGETARTAEEGEWIDASIGAVEMGDLSLRVAEVRVGHVEIISQGERTVSQNPCLIIRLQLTNVGAERRIDYETWANTSKGPSRHRLRLRDQSDRSYQQRVFPAGVEVPGQIRSGFMYPGKHLDDLLLFDPPSRDVRYLRLELPGSAVGGAGSLQIEIPRSMIRFQAGRQYGSSEKICNTTPEEQPTE